MLVMKQQQEELGVQHLMGKITKLEHTIARLEAMVCELVNRNEMVSEHGDVIIRHRHNPHISKKVEPKHMLGSKKKQPSKGEPNLFDLDLPF